MTTFGTEVSIPYTDAGGVISNPIVFEVIGVNHHTSEKHQQTITLMTKNIIRTAAFDAKEPNNPLYDNVSIGKCNIHKSYCIEKQTNLCMDIYRRFIKF